MSYFKLFVLFYVLHITYNWSGQMLQFVHPKKDAQ